MPASNMAGPLVVPANPTAGSAVLMNPFSGPTGSPLDNDQTGNNSTGALNTGIGFGLTTGPVINVSTGTAPATAPRAIQNAGFTDAYVPGITHPDGTAPGFAILTAIGGGRSDPATNGEAAPDPYSATPLLAFGNGVERDAGAGPEFTGHGMQMVTATGAVAVDADIEAGFSNRTGVAMVATDSAFGSNAADSVPIV